VVQESVASKGLRIGGVFNPYKLFVGVFIPNVLMRYKGIKPNSKLVWGRLAQYAGEKGYCWPSQDTLADETGLSRDTVLRSVKELEKDGFIVVGRPDGADKVAHKTSEYRFLFHVCFSTSQGSKLLPPEVADCDISYIRKESDLRESLETTSSEASIVSTGMTKESDIISDLNSRLRSFFHTNKVGFRLTRKYQELIRDRMKEGFVLEDFQKVHENMIARWGRDAKMRQYLRPLTLYGNKFDGYLNTPVSMADQGLVSGKTETSAAIAKEWAEGSSVKETM
jgi:uncharacterized phage protein (TIGR02220 family)